VGSPGGRGYDCGVSVDFRSFSSVGSVFKFPIRLTLITDAVAFIVCVHAFINQMLDGGARVSARQLAPARAIKANANPV
jgi:hypothetical protein